VGIALVVLDPKGDGGDVGGGHAAAIEFQACQFTVAAALFRAAAAAVAMDVQAVETLALVG
jgi:hypothetical protein